MSEHTDDDSLAAELRDSRLVWQETDVDPSLRTRVLDATIGRAGPRTRHRPVALLAAATVLVVAAGTAGWAIGTGTDDADALVAGPPGTLGAVERVRFDREPRGVEARASVVAHTWGTETVLDVSGLAAGRYTVVLTGRDGASLETGSFVAVPGVTDCRMNGAVLRDDVTGLRVLDAGGRAVMTADLPPTGA